MKKEDYNAYPITCKSCLSVALLRSPLLSFFLYFYFIYQADISLAATAPFLEGAAKRVEAKVIA
jgi:hypothetical protein